MIELYNETKGMEKIDDFPQHFMCPISMEVMSDPVTISTGVTYDRKNIEKWFSVYNKNTCPATMQSLHTFDITPNHTLKRLIASWRHSQSQSPPNRRGQLAAIIGGGIDATPFRLSCLRKLRQALEAGDDSMREEFSKSGEVKIITQILVDFAAIEACEEALGILHHLPDSDEITQLLINPNSMQSMAIVLHRGGSDARSFAISAFRRIARSDCCGSEQNHGVDFFNSLLDTAADVICAKASSCALQLLLEILRASRRSRLRAAEAGAVRALIELLPESRNRLRCERIMELIKLLCECAEGRLAFIEHGLGIAAVAEKLVDVSIAATRFGVKILWLVLSCYATDGVLEEVVVCGAVKKMVAVMQVIGGGEGMAATRGRVVKMLKLHGGRWRRCPCFPTQLNNI